MPTLQPWLGVLLHFVPAAAFAPPEGYVKTQRPTNLADGSDFCQTNSSTATMVPPVDVQMQLYVQKVHSIDELTQTWGLDGYLRLWWVDPRLRFEDSCKYHTLPDGNLLWVPEIYWDNGAETPVLGGLDGSVLRVYPDGRVWYSRAIRVTLTAPMSFSKFPYDAQTLALSIGSYTLSEDQQTLSWRRGAVALENWDGHALTTRWRRGRSRA